MWERQKPVNRQLLGIVKGTDSPLWITFFLKEPEMSKLIAGLVASLFAVSAFAAQAPAPAAAAPAASTTAEPAAAPAKKMKKHHKKAKKAAAADAAAAEPATK